MIDSLQTCPKCGIQESCYINSINEKANHYCCLNCGFSTSDLLIQGEYDTSLYENEMPELFKDIKYVDEFNRVWYPQVINIEGKGTVFPNGKNKESWQWSAIKSVELTEEEKKLPRFKNKSYKSDSSTLKNFGEDYFAACEYINLYSI